MPQKPDQTIVEQEAIKKDVDNTLKDATPEFRGKYIQEQIKNLNHRQAYQRRLARYRLQYTGEEVKPHLGELLNDKNERVRMAGMILAGKLGAVEHLEQIFDLFCKTTNKRARETARYALLVFATFKPEFFIGQLKSENQEVVALSVHALDSNYEKAAPELEKAFRTSDDPVIRKFAARIIGAFVCDKLDGMIATDRMTMYAYGLSSVHFSPEQIKATAEKAVKLTDLEFEVTVSMATDQNVRVYERRMALAVLGCLPQERAASALIKPVRENSIDTGALIHVLGWNGHPSAGKFLCEIFGDAKYANYDSLLVEALATNPNKELDADLRKMILDEKMSEEQRGRLAQIIAIRQAEGSLEFILSLVANKKDEEMVKYLPAFNYLTNQPAQEFFLNILRRDKPSTLLRPPAISYLVLLRNRAALDWIMANYESLSAEEKGAFAQRIFQLVQTQQDMGRCLTAIMFLAPKLDKRQAWQMLAPFTAILPKNDLGRYTGNTKIQEENYRKELQKILDWWEQNKKEEKYNFAVPAPAVAKTPAPATAPAPAPAPAKQ
jgi:hypothetical protein